MPTVDIVVQTELSRSIRSRQVESLFDVPAQEKCRLEFKFDLPIEDRPWCVGAIIGPSGSGKSTVLKEVFGGEKEIQWSGKSVIDDFPSSVPINDIADICQAVGFNTIPAWLRPYHVLSNGERFRVELARRMLETDPVIVDEFTSVVDRQVAKIGSHAFQKYIRRGNKTAVVASCHYDIIDWLQPDWVLDTASWEFSWRSLRRRPELIFEILRVGHKEWSRFAPFHYMSADLNKSAKCFVATVNDIPAAFAGVLYRPHPKAGNVYGVSRLVTLPDFQGLGLAMILLEKIGGMYKDLGRRLRMYPAHPALIRTFVRSKQWRLAKRPGLISNSSRRSKSSTIARLGGRPSATFEYVGPGLGDPAISRALAQ